MLPMLLTISFAHAGALQDGILGVAWGRRDTFPAPAADCRANPEPGVAWTCEQSIGDKPVSTSYRYEHQLLHGVRVRGLGSSLCSELLDVLQASFGPGEKWEQADPSKLAERMWMDGSVGAAWGFDPKSGTCTFQATHLPSFQAVQDATKANASLAHARKLTDGFRGLTWGLHETFPAPAKDCRERPEAGVAWSCEQTIGDVPVSISYVYDHHLLYGVNVHGKGYSACSYLIDVFEVAYGPGETSGHTGGSTLARHSWSAGPVRAGWDYDPTRDSCTLSIGHLPSARAVDQADKAKAAKAVSDL